MTEPAGPQPMPFDLWWSPSLRRFLSRHENQDDEHLVWVFHGHHEALRHYLGTGLDSNPPLPDDAVRLVLADPEQGSELGRLKAELEEAETDTDVLQGEINDAVTWLSAKGFAVNARECTMRQNVSRVVKQITAERDLALWLHAEAVWFLEQKQRELGMLHRQWSGARKTAGQRTSERDKLQARLDRVLTTCEAAATGISIGISVNPARWECAEAAITDVLAALQGNQSAEPEVPS